MYVFFGGILGALVAGVLAIVVTWQAAPASTNDRARRVTSTTS